MSGTLESPWTEDDVAAALAVQAEEDDRCGGCGHPLSESTHPDNQFAFTGQPVRCFACEANARATAEFVPSKGNPHARSGLMAVARHDQGDDVG